MRIEITSIPRGSAPQEVREQWIGVILTIVELPRIGSLHNIEMDFEGCMQPIRKNFVVNTDDAIAELAKKSPEAANWFIENLPREFDHLVFGLDEGKIVEP